MSATAVDISELDITVQDLLARLKREKEIILTAGNLPVAKLSAITESLAVETTGTTTGRRAGLTTGDAWMSPDFNEPLEDLADYMP